MASASAGIASKWELFLPVRLIVCWILEERKKFYPYYRHSSYLAGERDEVLPCHVEQQAGEVLFVPSMWTHQILNLAETVGFATEIHY